MDVLSHRRSSSIPCGFPAYCEVLRQEESTFASFFVEAISPVARDCLWAYADSLGLSVTLIYDLGLSFEATYAEARPLFELEASKTLNVSCPSTGGDVGCAHCNSLPVDACKLDPLCSTFEAGRFDAVRACVEPVEIGCGSASRGCTEFWTAGLSPDGACYLFSTGCQPQGFMPLEPNDPRCGANGRKACSP